MIGRPDGRLRAHTRPTFSSLLAGTALFVALGGSAAAATGLITASDIAPGAVTSPAIKAGAIEPRDLSKRTQALLGHGTAGAQGPSGAPGATGSPGSAGANGPNGANGVNGARGSDGTNGIDGTDGVNGTNGTDGTNGTNGTISPLSAKQGLVALPTGVAATTVVQLSVPAGNYVVLGKTEISATGAGDTVECLLKAGSVTVDESGMKTLPALAATTAPLQATITAPTSPTILSIQCSVVVANGSANFNSLIAIPTA